MSKWEYTTLDKLGFVERGKQQFKKIHKSLFWGGYIPFIDASTISNNKLYVSKNSRNYNLKGLNQSKLFHKNTVCFAETGFGGNSVLLRINSCLAKNVYGFNSKGDISFATFIKYCFDWKIKRIELLAHSNLKATRSTLSLNKLLLVKFPKPPYEIQKKIGEILSIYDIILENNEKQIELLKNLRISLFREWFIKFRFPNFEENNFIDGIPEGWKKVKLGDISTVQKGSKPASHANLLVPGGGGSIYSLPPH